MCYAGILLYVTVANAPEFVFSSVGHIWEIWSRSEWQNWPIRTKRCTVWDWVCNTGISTSTSDFQVWWWKWWEDWTRFWQFCRVRPHIWIFDLLFSMLFFPYECSSYLSQILFLIVQVWDNNQGKSCRVFEALDTPFISSFLQSVPYFTPPIGIGPFQLLVIKLDWNFSGHWFANFIVESSPCPSNPE